MHIFEDAQANIAEKYVAIKESFAESKRWGLESCLIFEANENPGECFVKAWLMYYDMKSGSDILVPKPSRKGSSMQMM